MEFYATYLENPTSESIADLTNLLIKDQLQSGLLFMTGCVSVSLLAMILM